MACLLRFGFVRKSLLCRVPQDNGDDLSTPETEVEEESTFDDFDDEFDDDFEEEENDPDWDHPEDNDGDTPPPAKGRTRKK